MRRFRTVLAAVALLAAVGGVAPCSQTHQPVPVRLAPAVRLTRPASAVQG